MKDTGIRDLLNLELSHAPGPWIERNGHITTRQCFDSKFSDKICTLEWGNTKQDEANGILIAIAPDLLKIAIHLEAMRGDAHFSGHPEWEEIMKRLDVIKGDIYR